MEPTLGLILAGGRSRRMGGGDKALMLLAGRPLLAHVAARLAPQCAVTVISANGDPARFAPFGLDVVADDVPDFAGPLAGILAGMDVAYARDLGWIVSVPVDTPVVPHDLVARLHAARGGELRPVVAASGARRHPAVGLWPVGLRGALRHAVATDGVRRVGDFAERHAAAIADWPTAPHDPFLNLNTPADVAAAEAFLAAISRPCG